MPINNPPLFTNFCGCAPRQSTQIQIFGDNVPINRSLGNTSFLQFLKSSSNSAILSITEALTKPNGKKTNLVIQMEEPICPTFCNSPITCNTAYVELNGGISCFDLSIGSPYHLCDGTSAPAAWSFKKADWKNYCDEDDDLRLQSQFSKVNKKLVEFVDKEMVNLLRQNIPASQEHSLPFYLTIPNSVPVVNPHLMFTIEQLERDGGYDGDYVIFGGLEALKLTQFLNVASASQVGYDITKQSSGYPPIFYDRNFDAYFPNQLVVIPYKAIQFATWNEFTGQGGQMVDGIIKDATTEYLLGGGSTLKLDYRWKHDIDCREYLYDPRLYAELFLAPRGGCINDTEFNGILIIENCSTVSTPVCP